MLFLASIQRSHQRSQRYHSEDADAIILVAHDEGLCSPCQDYAQLIKDSPGFTVELKTVRLLQERHD
jgi:hypothetical protein